MEQIRQMGVRLHLSDSQILAACRAYARDSEGLWEQAQKVRKSGNVAHCRRTLRSDTSAGGARVLAVALAMACQAEEDYQIMGITSEVFDATFSDIRIWADHYRAKMGVDGLGEIGWIVNHCRLKIFRLGRLQFERTIVHFPPFTPLHKRKLTSVRQGDHCLGVHIPEGEKLDIDACERDFTKAPNFFRRYFPNEQYTCFTCLSWLLSSVYGQILPQESNIVRFHALWDNVWDVHGDHQAIERIWSSGDRDARDTLLQQQAAAWLDHGNRLGMGFGIRQI